MKYKKGRDSNKIQPSVTFKMPSLSIGSVLKNQGNDLSRIIIILLNLAISESFWSLERSESLNVKRGYQRGDVGFAGLLEMMQSGRHVSLVNEIRPENI